MAEYDVFISHGSADAAETEATARRLVQEAELRPFLDRWALVPGDPWQSALETALAESKVVAVLIGSGSVPAGLEIELLEKAAEAGKRIIPVLLPGARREELPDVLRQRTWVDLNEEGGFERLVSGILGQPPRPLKLNEPRRGLFLRAFTPWRDRELLVSRIGETRATKNARTWTIAILILNIAIVGGLAGFLVASLASSLR